MARTLKCDTIIHHQGSSANITLATGLTDFGTIDVNIDGGNIDGVTIGTSTIGTSNITVPSGKTLNVEQGTFTTSTAQKNAILTDSTALTLSNSNQDVAITNALTVTGNTIKSSAATALTLSGANVTVAGDLTVSGNDISCGNATMNLKPNGNTRLSITTGGDVAITGDLTVTGNQIKDSGGGNTISMDGSNNVTVLGDLTVTGNDIATASTMTFKPGGTAKMELQTDGDLVVMGDITAFGTLSDENMKKDIANYREWAMGVIGKLSVKTFLYKDEYKNHAVREGRQIGLIAQQLEQFLPEAVKTKDDGTKTIQYEVVVAILIQAVQEIFQQGIPNLHVTGFATEKKETE